MTLHGCDSLHVNEPHRSLPDVSIDSLPDSGACPGLVVIILCQLVWHSEVGHS